MRLMLGFIFGMVCLQPGYGNEADVHRLIDQFHASAANSDFDGYFDAFTADAYFLGTDDHERWSVPDFKQYAKPAFAAGRGWSYEVESRNVESGSVSGIYWFDEVLSNAALGRCRGTGVVVATAAGLKIAHYSLSLLIPNEIAESVGRQSMAHDSE